MMRAKLILCYVASALVTVVATSAALPAKLDLSSVDLAGVPQLIELKPPTAQPVCEVISAPPAEDDLALAGVPLPAATEGAPSGAGGPQPVQQMWPFEADALRARELAEMVLALQPELQRWLVSEIAYYTAKFTRNTRHIAEIPPEVFLSLLYEESFFRPDARGRAGELGMAQILPSTARGQGFAVERLSWDVMYQVECGVAYLVGCVHEAGGDVREGLARYNGGPHPGRRSYVYADRILRRAEAFRSTQTAEPAHALR